MPDQKSVVKHNALPAKATELVVGAAGKISPVDALNALNQLVGAARESLQIHETESTKREKLRTYRETEVARIKASEKILRKLRPCLRRASRDAQATVRGSRPGT